MKQGPLRDRPQHGGPVQGRPVLRRQLVIDGKILDVYKRQAHNGVEKPFIDYVLPLIQGEPKLPKVDSLPRFARLKKVLVK